jgi:hypothetical protein
VRKRVLVILAAVAVAIVLALQATVLHLQATVLHLQGGFQDVPFTVTIANDTRETIIDHSFFGTNYGTKGVSGKYGQTVVVPPGQSFRESEYYNEGVDFDRITTASGTTLGCLPFQFSKQPPKTLTVRVTQMIPCQRWSQYGSDRQDWPDPNL